MVFTPASWVPSLPAVPDSITVDQFMNSNEFNCRPIGQPRNVFTCGLTGKAYSPVEVAHRVDLLARGIRQKLNIFPNEGTEFERVAALFCVNTIDFISVTYAMQRLNGIVTPASAVFSAPELEHQLRVSGARSIFTCAPLLPVALEAAERVGISRDAIILLPVPGHANVSGFTTIEDLVAAGQTLPKNEPLQWIKGQGNRQVAYMCFSSGTSGLPKAVMLTHANVISNIMQVALFEAPARKQLGIETQVSLGLLPLTHAYGLFFGAHVAHFRGDELVILPKFEVNSFLNAIQRFRIQVLYLVPPILIAMLANQQKVDSTDLSSVRTVVCGAAPMGPEMQDTFKRRFPTWRIMQGYGMTECSPIITMNSEADVLNGSSGSLLPGMKAKLVNHEGKEVTDYNTPGEMLIGGPNVAAGYLNNEKANAETFVHHQDGRWLRSGDEVVVRLSADGHEHFVIVDRIKELIKVKAHQVAPAELEAHLLTHALVADCAVISVPDERDGEAAKAIVVLAKGAAAEGSDAELAEIISAHVREHKAKHKWLKGGVDFVEAIPKSPSGKILRRILRDEEKARRKATSANL